MTFKNKIKQSFQKVKQDFDVLRVSFADWIGFLNQKQTAAERRIEALERRITQLEESERIVVKAY